MLDPRSLQSRDRVTIIFRDPDDGRLRAHRGLFRRYSTDGYLGIQVGGANPLLLYRHAREGVFWIRGWPARDGVEVRALMAASTLAERTNRER